MSFKGDLSTIGLAEVFQMISMSQKEGTLLVQDAESRKAIYFGPTGVKLASSGKRKGLRLGDILIRTGRITPESLQDALENSKIQKKMLGEVLVETGVVTDAEIQQMVREQIEEEIYDLFLWKRANFEFVEGAAAEGLKDPDATVTSLSFDVNGLLLEAVRRADEWAIINQKLPSIDSIFTWVSPQARAEEDESAPDASKRVYRLVDGQTPVSEIVENTGVPKFEACKVLVDLLDRGRIRLLEVAEILSVAQHRLTEGHKDRATKIYLAAGAQAPQDPKVAAALGRVFEGEGLSREAALQFARAGRLHLEQGQIDHALDHMRKAGELQPEDLEIRTGIFEVHAAAGNLEDGKRMAMELATESLMNGNPARARTLCDRILRADPEDLDFRLVRAKALHRMNQKKDLEEDLTFIRKKMPQDQKKVEEINNALKEFVPKTPTSKTTPAVPKEAPKKKGLKKGALAGGVAVVALLGGGVYEGVAMRQFGDASTRASQLADKQDFAEARRAIDGFLAGPFGFSLLQKGRADTFLKDLDQRALSWEGAKAAGAERARQAAAERAKALETQIAEERATNPDAALEHAAELRKVAEGVKDQATMKRADEISSALQRYLYEALQLKVQADALEKEGKFKEAAETIYQLMGGYHNTKYAASATYPLEITARPPGVKVTTRAGLVVEEASPGRFIHRMKDGEVVRLVFEKPGYATVEQQVKDKRVGKMTVELTEKRERWAMPLGFPSTAEPALGDDVLFVPDGSRLYALRLSSQRLLWTEAMESTIVGSPRYAQGVVMVAMGNSVVAIEQPKAGEKKVAWKVALGDRATCTPGLSPDGTTLYVSALDRQLVALNVKTGETAWKKQLPAEAVAEPVVVGGTLVVACEDGSVVGLTGATPQEAWRVRGDAGYLASSVFGSEVYLTGGDASLQAIDARGGTRLWKTGMPVSPAGRPVRVGGAVYIAGKNGVVYFLDASTGNSVGSYKTDGPILGGVTSFGPLLLFGSEDRTFTAFDTSRGAPAWKWKCERRLRNGAIAKDGVVYFCGEDTLYAIDLN